MINGIVYKREGIHVDKILVKPIGLHNACAQKKRNTGLNCTYHITLLQVDLLKNFIET